MSNKTVEEIRTKLGRPSREKQYYVSKLAVADFVKNACSVNKFALQEVEIKQGTDLGHIVIVFTYLKLKKP